jgi:hypothetical protein
MEQPIKRAMKSFKSEGKYWQKLGKAQKLLDETGKEIVAKTGAFWTQPTRGIGKLSELLDARKTDSRK